MKKLWFLVVLSCALLLVGCKKNNMRADYLDAQTENSLLKNTVRVATVLSPLSMGARILVSEMSRDMNDESADAKKTAGKKAGAPENLVAETPKVETASSEPSPIGKTSYYIIDNGETYTFSVKP